MSICTACIWTLVEICMRKELLVLVKSRIDWALLSLHCLQNDIRLSGKQTLCMHVCVCVCTFTIQSNWKANCLKMKNLFKHVVCTIHKWLRVNVQSDDWRNETNGTMNKNKRNTKHWVRKKWTVENVIDLYIFYLRLLRKESGRERKK